MVIASRDPARRRRPCDDIATLIPRAGLAIPFAILSVMVPAGVYRQLKGEDTPVDIFA